MLISISYSPYHLIIKYIFSTYKNGSLNGMLRDEDQNDKGGDRFRNLRLIMSEDSALLKSCETDLEQFKCQLLKDEEHREGVKGQVMAFSRKIKWSLQKADVQRLIDNMRNVAAQIERAQSIDTTLVYYHPFHNISWLIASV